MSLRKSQTDALGILRDVSQTLTPSARKKDVEIAVEVENGLPLILGRRRALAPSVFEPDGKRDQVHPTQRARDLVCCS